MTKPSRNTAALHFTPAPVVLGVLRAHARLLAGGGPAVVGPVVEGLARGTLAPLPADLWSAADRMALRLRGETSADGIASEVETLVVNMLAGEAELAAERTQRGRAMEHEACAPGLLPGLRAEVARKPLTPPGCGPEDFGGSDYPPELPDPQQRQVKVTAPWVDPPGCSHRDAAPAGAPLAQVRPTAGPSAVADAVARAKGARGKLEPCGHSSPNPADRCKLPSGHAGDHRSGGLFWSDDGATAALLGVAPEPEVQLCAPCAAKVAALKPGGQIELCAPCLARTCALLERPWEFLPEGQPRGEAAERGEIGPKARP